ncbi:hypothetical protein AVEN_203002-1 [Araneus ventricosus]|uniref:Uncharacterized protein n=1 Tax=Araneus ventricosus TaxID=182803 RepID=A0A4Y2ERB0_ARAVE|nr:hypothetical protein AVEN_203002-1 [Araneus ventricosus]
MAASPGALVNPLPSPKSSSTGSRSVTTSAEAKVPSRSEKTRFSTSLALTSITPLICTAALMTRTTSFRFSFRNFAKVLSRCRDFVSHRIFPFERDTAIFTGENASRRNDDHPLF